MSSYFLLPREGLNVGEQVEEVDVRVRCVKCQGAIQACILLLVECIVGRISYSTDDCLVSHTLVAARGSRRVTLASFL